MNARRLRLLDLMAQCEKRDMGAITAQMATLRSHEMQQFDLIAGLDRLLEQADQQEQRCSRGALSTRHFLQQSLVTQRESAKAELATLHDAYRAQMVALGAHQQRKTVLEDRAKAAKRQISAIKAAKTD